MKRLGCVALLFMLIQALLGVTPSAQAGLLSPSEASALVQSTASDSDALLLSLFYGYESGQTLNYQSSSTSTSWAGALSGTYAGTSLSLNYLGDLSSYPSGPITWTTSGVYGSQTWSGVGSAIISDTSATTFQVGLMYSMTVGGNSASLSYVIPGTVASGGKIMYGSPGNGEVGSGNLILNGSLDLNVIRFSYLGIGESLQFSDIGILDENWYNAAVLSRGIIIGPVKTPSTPEPASWLLMTLGIVGLLCIGAKGKGSRSFQLVTDKCARTSVI